MDTVAGCEASDDEALGDAGVVKAVAEAVAWLALRRVLYTDVRGPNVLVPAVGAGEVPVPRLVDYDDCVVTAEPVRCIAGFRDALREVVTARSARRSQFGGFAARFLAGQCGTFSAALAEAFARQNDEL